MRVLLTGSSGRIGRAIHARLSEEHSVIGIDERPAETTRVVASVTDTARLRSALEGVDAVVHTAALHAPHVGVAGDADFESVNVRATASLVDLCLAAGVGKLVFTSTTALYGDASTLRGRAAWIDERTEPRPRTIYHRTKLRAEEIVKEASTSGKLSSTVLRMSRCFPEPANLMAVYRLHRGIDARDVAEAHRLALQDSPEEFRLFVVSHPTPFTRADLEALWSDAPSVIRHRAPGLAHSMETRGWHLPQSIDRVYCSDRARTELSWRARYDYSEVLRALDQGSPTVLPPA
ncbi:MAG: NAD(P)-dependent oxidoreductase [Sedimentisphaerales bacterium]